MTLEVLHGALVLLGRRARTERAEVAAAAGLRVDFARIEAIAARLELADHRRPSLCSRCHREPPSMVSSFLPTMRRPRKFRLIFACLRSIGERAASAESQPTKELDVAPSPPAPDRECHPRPAEIRDRGSR